MGTYYPTTSAQIDVLSAPYNQDQKFTSFSEPNVLHGNMMMYMNPNTSTGNFSEISSLNPNNGEQFSSMSGRNEMMFIPPTSDHTSMQAISCPLNAGTVKNVDKFIPGLNSRDQLGMMEGEQMFQSLSLSLSTQMSTPAFEYQYTNPGMNLQSESSVRQMSFKIDESFSQGDGNNTIRFGLPNSSPQFSMSAKDVNFGQYQSGVASVLLKSKYLKVAQQLLDEIVNVREAVKRHELGKDQVSGKVEDGSKESRGESQPPADANESDIGSSSAHELSSAEKQDLQNKLDKLLSMLDEVDRKYKQYGQQMQILVSSFDIVAGNGAAKPYTALALKTISRHFRCLRDAITDQIQATRKSLGEPDNGMGAPIPRLRYVDQQLRQQRALQQFGMMRHAWRPQRGLPETAVTILRAWLFEHFLHPYPKDSEKIMLARQAGLTRGQVANWFINARVRLWKPMVEEMYKEEFGEAEINCSEDNTTHEMQESSTSMAHDSKANVTHNTEMKGHSSSNLGQHVNTLVNNDLNHGFYTTDLLVTSGAYQMSELSNFSVDNQVSLDLGLQHPADADVVTRFQVNPTTSNYQYTGQGNQQDNSFGNQHIDFVT